MILRIFQRLSFNIRCKVDQAVYVLADFSDKPFVHRGVVAVLYDCPFFDELADARGLAPVSLQLHLC